VKDPNNPGKIVIDLDDLSDDYGRDQVYKNNSYSPNQTRKPASNSYNQNLHNSNQGYDYSPVSNPSHKGYNDIYCKDCGNVINREAEVCPRCGVRQTRAMSLSGKNRTTAAILAFFLGGLGVHKFYLGQSGMGILYLLFCWTFIPATVGFVEGIIYLTMSDEQFFYKYR